MRKRKFRSVKKCALKRKTKVNCLSKESKEVKGDIPKMMKEDTTPITQKNNCLSVEN